MNYTKIYIVFHCAGKIKASHFREKRRGDFFKFCTSFNANSKHFKFSIEFIFSNVEFERN